jgi:hypothetical protein
LVNVESPLTLGVDHPKDLLDVGGHVVELTLSRFENLGCFGMPPTKVEGEASHRENYQASFPKPGKAGTKSRNNEDTFGFVRSALQTTTKRATETTIKAIEATRPTR